MRTTIPIAIIAATLLASSGARADYHCPQEISSLLHTGPAWYQYSINSNDYIRQLLRRLSSGLAAIADARGDREAIDAGVQLGKSNAQVMRRMWEEGFIAATDIIYAHCDRKPDTLPWDDEIREANERAWCDKESSAHFCDER